MSISKLRGGPRPHVKSREMTDPGVRAVVGSDAGEAPAAGLHGGTALKEARF